ncbi:MAG: hypothetical protein WC785_10815 [Tatlockia sp.]|jgi:hypothetical protein
MIDCVEPELPKKIKPSEEKRVNPAYTQVAGNASFVPLPGVTYLWVLNQDKKLIVGLERPWEHPDAFNFDLQSADQKKQWEQIAGQLQHTDEDSHEGFGHPTLGVGFFKRGAAKVGAAYLGGELNFREGTWIVDNKSGRHGHFKEQDKGKQALIANTLLVVVNQFKGCGLDVSPQLYFEFPKIHSASIPIFSNKKEENLLLPGQVDLEALVERCNAGS